jgi:divalent metal cation (Fe/Co/Zn/Cd) transporter
MERQPNGEPSRFSNQPSVESPGSRRSVADARRRLVRRGLWLNYLTIGYNGVEAIVSIASGLLAGSIALVGFGIDSVIEVTASVAAQWRLRADLDHARRERVERVTVRVIGWSFLALAAYVLVDSSKSLWLRDRPEQSISGIVILSLSLVVMPLLARAKRRVARGLSSRALAADATQTSLCAWLSGIALAGVVVNAAVGWWWADPVAALAMVPIIAKEGVDGVRGDRACEKCC